MKIKYLGTAAYEGVPAIFCNCDVCQRSREIGGRNIRSRSQALINDNILVDFNADSIMHYQKYLYDWNKIDTCLITHSHSDHLYVEDMLIARTDYTHGNNTVLNYYSDKASYEIIKRKLSDAVEGAHMNEVAKAHLIVPGEAFITGKNRILPLRAHHAKNSDPVIYAISDGKKNLLYGNDSGYFLEETWEGLKKFGKFDLVSLDCTSAIIPGWKKDYTHMGYETCLETVQRMKAEGMADDTTKFVITHFSHNGKATYDNMKEIADKDGIITAYDGLEIEF